MPLKNIDRENLSSMTDAEKEKNWMLHLRPAADQDLMEMMSWISDKVSCKLWGGPMIRFPLTLDGLKKDICYQDDNTFSLISAEGALLGLGQLLKKTGKRIHLARIIVSPEYRRQGFGEKLCRNLMETGKKRFGESEFSLNVYAENGNAMNLYTKLGFKEHAAPSEVAADASVVYMVKARDIQLKTSGQSMMNSNSEEAKRWASNPVIIQRARTMLAVSLSKRASDELVRVLMDWIDDNDLQSFCIRYLEDADLKWILR